MSNLNNLQTDKTVYKERIRNVSRFLKEHNYFAAIAPIRDLYGSQLAEQKYSVLKWLTGFTGSNGLCIILKNAQAIFFTDSRYTLQASIQLDGLATYVFDLQRTRPNQWLKQANNTKDTIVYDPHRHPVGFVQDFRVPMLEIRGLFLQCGFPETPLPKSNINLHCKDMNHIRPNVASVIKAMEKHNIDALFISDPHAINWLISIRGNDNPYTPILNCFGILYSDGTIDCLCYQDVDINKEVANYFDKHFISIVHYKKELIQQNLLERNVRYIGYDHQTLPASIYSDLYTMSINFKKVGDIVSFYQAIKKDDEIESIKEIHKIEAAIFIEFWYWLHTRVENAQYPTEQEAAEYITTLREQEEKYHCPSFNTISSFGSNAAIIHYDCRAGDNKTIEPDGLYLVDTGAQYKNGTTDLTRTLGIGKITDEQKLYYTKVLKGHIALASIRFPVGTTGAMLDVLARQYIWAEYEDYGHSTGHGVGCFLNVHEGPYGIGRFSNIPLQAGMLLSNEPGFYKEYEYGIRLENLMVVKKCKDNTSFLEFEIVSKVPFDHNMIDYDLLSLTEMEWLNAYHNDVIKNVSSKIRDKEIEVFLHKLVG